MRRLALAACSLATLAISGLARAGDPRATQPLVGAAFAASDDDIAFVRRWPGAISLDAGRFNLHVTSHAAFGVSPGGARVAEAGALVRLEQRVMQAVSADDATKPARSARFFLYAGASGRTYGPDLNLMSDAGTLNDGFVHDTVAGLGFEAGPVAASFGFQRERVSLRDMGDARPDDRVGLTLRVR